MLILNDFTFPSFIPNIHFMMFPFVKSTFDIKWNGVWWSSFVASNTIDFPLLIPYVSIRIYTLSYHVDYPFFLYLFWFWWNMWTCPDSSLAVLVMHMMIVMSMMIRMTMIMMENWLVFTAKTYMKIWEHKH